MLLICLQFFDADGWVTGYVTEKISASKPLGMAVNISALSGLGTVHTKNFGLSFEDAQDKDDWRQKMEQPANASWLD